MVFEFNVWVRLCILCNVVCVSFGIVKNCCNSIVFIEFRKIILCVVIVWGNGNFFIKRWVMFV